MTEQVSTILARLTGQEAPTPAKDELQAQALLEGSGLGYSQLNELLLASGYDRVSPGFFRYLLAGGREESTEAAHTAFKSVDSFSKAVEQFRIWAVLSYGNVKYAFKYLSKLDDNSINLELESTAPIDEEVYSSRHEPLIPIEQIAGTDTYYLGYIIARELNDRLAENPEDEVVREELKKRDEIVAKGKRNHEAYLTSDHMDVYVATSMRERHEYQVVADTVAKVFADPRLRNLKIRWFDPTQAYCEDRIDKGLVEALMLRRAQCTLYLAQEADTLGKDSELASTLAQGKPVIAYVPRVPPDKETEFADELLRMVGDSEAPGNLKAILGQLRVYAPEAAWNDPEVQEWIRCPAQADTGAAKAKLARAIRKHYEKRATTLKDSHPLGLQVNLETGVANGVLVARTLEECAELVFRVLTATLEFALESQAGSLVLRERVTGSIFRVVTGDKLLTNSFWNFYLLNVANSAS